MAETPPSAQLFFNIPSTVTSSEPELPLPSPMLAESSAPFRNNDADVRMTDADAVQEDPWKPERYPFVGGEDLMFYVKEKDIRVKAKILKSFPSTLSCVMVIRLPDSSLFAGTSECIIKLYDHRFSRQLRTDSCIPTQWSKALEQEYREFVETGAAAEYFSYWTAELERDPYWHSLKVENSENWSAAKDEAYLQFDALKFYSMENNAYRNMVDLQGHDIPMLLGHVVLLSPEDFSSDTYEPKASSKYLSCPGLLLEYIPGVEFTDLGTSNVPRHLWQSCCDRAISIIHRTQDRGVCNRDVQMRSFIYNKDTDDLRMLDFGLVKFRNKAENDREFNRWLALEDEEGRFGVEMQTLLDESGGGYKYRRSERVERLTYRYMREEGENEGGSLEEDAFIMRDYLANGPFPNIHGQNHVVPTFEKKEERKTRTRRNSF